MTTSRKERRRAAATIVPPEGVPLTLPVAGVGVRIGAQITDVLITGLFAVAVIVLVTLSGWVGLNGISALAALIFFAIRVPYYVLTELAWNGQTLGKRLMKIKVVAHTGGSLTTHALVLRNVMKEAEVFLPGTLLMTLNAQTPVASWISFGWVVMALLIPLTNAHRMRLGDFLASTHVVHLPEVILLPDMARAAASTTAQQFTFESHQLDHYGRFELQTLETFLRAQAKSAGRPKTKREEDTTALIVERVRNKIGYADKVERANYLDFLQSFYNAQRAHLEQRQLFGDKRSDKFHAANRKTDDGEK